MFILKPLVFDKKTSIIDAGFREILGEIDPILRKIQGKNCPLLGESRGYFS